MKLLVLGCKTLREGVVASAIFFLAAVLMILAGRYVVPDVLQAPYLVMALGLFMLLLAPVILVSTFLLSVLPGAKEKLDQCEH